MAKRTLWKWAKKVHDLKIELAEAKDLIEKKSEHIKNHHIEWGGTKRRKYESRVDSRGYLNQKTVSGVSL